MNLNRAQSQVKRINQLAAFLPGLAELPGRASMMIAGDLDIYVESLAEFKSVRRHFFGKVQPYARHQKTNSFQYYFNEHKYELKLTIFIKVNDSE